MLLDVYEFENTFDFDSLLPILESSLRGPAPDFAVAKSEYEKGYNLRTIFQMDPGDIRTSNKRGSKLIKMTSPGTALSRPHNSLVSGSKADSQTVNW